MKHILLVLLLTISIISGVKLKKILFLKIRKKLRKGLMIQIALLKAKNINCEQNSIKITKEGEMKVEIFMNDSKVETISCSVSGCPYICDNNISYFYQIVCGALFTELRETKIQGDEIKNSLCTITHSTDSDRIESRKYFVNNKLQEKTIGNDKIQEYEKLYEIYTSKK